MPSAGVTGGEMVWRRGRYKLEASPDPRGGSMQTRHGRVDPPRGRMLIGAYGSTTEEVLRSRGYY